MSLHLYLLGVLAALLLGGCGILLLRSSRQRRRLLALSAALSAEVETLKAAVAAHRRESESLRPAAERFHLTLRNSPVILYTTDRDLRYTWVYNGRFGWPLEIVGRRDDDLMPPEEAAPLLALKRSVLDTGIGARREAVVSTPIGPLCFDLTVEPLLDDSGQIDGVSVAAVDITDRKRAEEALHQSEERLRLALESADMIAWELDPATGRTAPMGDVLRLLGITEDELTTAESYFRFVHPDDRARALRQQQAALRGEHDFDVDYRFVRPDGTVRWMNDHGRVAFDEQGRPVRMSGMLRDITARHEAEERLRQAKRAAEEANDAKDRFLAALSHELRTPLTPILTVSASLEEDCSLAEEVRCGLAMIRRNAELEARLIDDLLDLTRVAHGKLELHYDVTDLREVIEHAIETCCGREAASGRIELRTDLRAAEHRVWGDTSRLTQVFWNLLNNAVKFTPAGGTITVATHEEEGARRELIVEVTDTGIGIAPDILPRIFDAFEQGDRRITRQFGGLGLGLAVCRAILELHGGGIETFSEGIGHGATFVVRLPAGLPAEALEHRPVPAVAVPAAAASSEPLHILLVEDHPDTAEAMAELLRAFGHHVTAAATVAGALAATAAAAAAHDGIDLVVSDLGLPDGSGQDLMRELVSRYGLRGIALSGYGMEDDVRKSLEAGFDRHLTKPVSPQILRSAISQTAQSTPAI